MIFSVLIKTKIVRCYLIILEHVKINKDFLLNYLKIRVIGVFTSFFLFYSVSWHFHTKNVIITKEV